jgi:hypothetical protein
MSNKLIRILVLAAVFMGLAADDALAAAKAKRVKGNLRGTATYSPTNVAAGVYTVTVQARGNLSHLGWARATWQGEISLDANLQPTALTGLGFTLTTPQGTLSGPITWTATTSTNEPGVYSLSGTFQTAAGGTRKLQGATGHGTVTATINVLTGKTTIQIDALVTKLRRKEQ